MSSTIIPTMRYKDAPRMIDWLCDAFGFEKHAVHEDDRGGIAHAQLTLGDGMIMLGSERDDELGKLMKTPDQLNGPTQSAYIVVADIESVFERAKKAGAEIVKPLEDQDYGGKLFSCRDPEGYLWHLGSYNPWG